MKLINKTKVEEARIELNNLYNSVPETKGCMENLSVCKGKCCTMQNPSLLHVEFINLWKHILIKYSLDEIVLIIKKAAWNYMTDTSVKGCIFFDDTNKTCTVHEHRPLACRVYSQEPKEEFNKKIIKLKVLNPNKYYMEQCSLTETVGKVPAAEDTEKWWNKLKSIEKSIGIMDREINDSDIGTYRTYHDHIMLNLLSDADLRLFTEAKQTNDVRLQGAVLGDFVNKFKAKMVQVEKSAIEALKAKENKPDELGDYIIKLQNKKEKND